MIHYLCGRGHKVSAPVALLICPLASCQEELTRVGPNWGPLKSRKQTQAHYAAEAEKADA